MRVVRKYKDYVKETIDDDKFSRKKYEKDVAQKKKKKDGTLNIKSWTVN